MSLDPLDGPDLAPPMLAADLSALYLPMWVRQRAARRLNGEGMATWSWHAFARIAVSHAQLPPNAQLVYRVLVDWHGNGSRDCTPRLADVADQASLGREWTQRTVTALGEWGWLHTEPRRGQPSILTLTVPMADPPDRRQESPRPRDREFPDLWPPGHNPPVATGPQPRGHRATPPVATGPQHRGTGVPGTERGVASSSENAVPRAPRPGFGGWASNRPRGPRGPNRQRGDE